jgi:hypothetical protein
MTSQQGARQAPTARPYYVGELIQKVHAGMSGAKAGNKLTDTVPTCRNGIDQHQRHGTPAVDAG